MKSGSRIACLTGATGFVGWRVGELLRDQGWTVRAIVRPANRKRLPEGLQPVEAALVGTDASGTAAALAHACDGCELIVHVAGRIRAPSEAAFNEVNVGATRAVVGAANATGGRVIAISSLAAGGPGTVARPCREDETPRPLNPYGRSKLAGEQVLRTEARVPWTIIRPPAVYGPRDRGFLPLFRMAARGIFLQAVAPAMPFSFVFIDDLAAAVAAVAAAGERAAGGTFFIAHPEVSTADDLLRQLAAIYGRPYRPWRVPGPALGALAWLGDRAWGLGVKPLLDSGRLREFRAEGFVCAVDRARDVLGFDARVPLAEGLQRTARWYHDLGWVPMG
jgi:nucleoside-diphosphate-sugar epimerase